MNVTLLVHHIEWDTGSNEAIQRSLPTKMELEIDLTSPEHLFPVSINEQICNKLTEATGCFVRGYKLQGYSVEADFALQMTLGMANNRRSQ